MRKWEKPELKTISLSETSHPDKYTPNNPFNPLPPKGPGCNNGNGHNKGDWIPIPGDDTLS